MLEVFLRSYCCRNAFDICMVHLVLHGMWRCFFFMVYGDGCILRTYGVPGKGVVYVIILGVRMVLFLYHGILLIRV